MDRLLVMVTPEVLIELEVEREIPGIGGGVWYYFCAFSLGSFKLKTDQNHYRLGLRPGPHSGSLWRSQTFSSTEETTPDPHFQLSSTPLASRSRRLRHLASHLIWNLCFINP